MIALFVAYPIFMMRIPCLLLALFYSEFTLSQIVQDELIVRFSIGNASSNQIDNQHNYTQQSIGQQSPMGTFYLDEFIVIQGFIHPENYFEFRGHLNMSSNNLIVYPNPFNSMINVSLSELINTKFNVIIYSISGQQLFNETFLDQENATIATENLPVGYYIIKVSANGLNTYKKLIKANDY